MNACLLCGTHRSSDERRICPQCELAHDQSRREVANCGEPLTPASFRSLARANIVTVLFWMFIGGLISAFWLLVIGGWL